MEIPGQISAEIDTVAAGVFAATLITSAAHTAGPDVSAQSLLSSWHDEDPGMRMVAEVIASAFASGFSWGGDAAGKRVYCASSQGVPVPGSIGWCDVYEHGSWVKENLTSTRREQSARSPTLEPSSSGSFLFLGEVKLDRGRGPCRQPSSRENLG